MEKLLKDNLEMYKQLNETMSGHPSVPAQQAAPVDTSVDLPELTIVGIENYTPKAMKAKAEMEKKFSASVGPLIDKSIPWKK